jgi:hypothetical protein
MRINFKRCFTFVSISSAHVRYDSKAKLWDLPLTVLILIVGFVVHEGYSTTSTDRAGHLLGLAVGALWVLLSARMSSSSSDTPSSNPAHHAPYVYMRGEEEE